jgi:hypothetical protein
MLIVRYDVKSSKKKILKEKISKKNFEKKNSEKRKARKIKIPKNLHCEKKDLEKGKSRGQGWPEASNIDGV